MKQAFDALVPQFLASLQEGAGGDKGTVAGQQDIELIDELGHGDVAEDGHADNGPDQTIHGHTATTQGRDILFGEQGCDELGSNEVRELFKLIGITTLRSPFACSMCGSS